MLTASHVNHVVLQSGDAVLAAGVEAVLCEGVEGQHCDWLSHPRPVHPAGGTPGKT